MKKWSIRVGESENKANHIESESERKFYPTIPVLLKSNRVENTKARIAKSCLFYNKTSSILNIKNFIYKRAKRNKIMLGSRLILNQPNQMAYVTTGLFLFLSFRL